MPSLSLLWVTLHKVSELDSSEKQSEPFLHCGPKVSIGLWPIPCFPATQKKKSVGKTLLVSLQVFLFFITFSIISFAGLTRTASFFRVSAFHPLASCLFCHIYAVRCCDHICQAVSERSTRPRYSSKSGRCAFSSFFFPTPSHAFR